MIEFLTRKWEHELDYVLRKSLWGFRGNRIAVRFQYEWRDASHQWYRSYGNELWEFDDDGLMRRREASIKDLPIAEAERRFHGPRSANERGQGHDIPPAVDYRHCKHPSQIRGALSTTTP
ncbi:hypothetical protein IWGMT90018_40910 [Mycobacterium kiyosense]|nr:hypothetical protein IWGMT90018_40910 [Mycobacterium kiyosense]